MDLVPVLHQLMGALWTFDSTVLRQVVGHLQWFQTLARTTKFSAALPRVAWDLQWLGTATSFVKQVMGVLERHLTELTVSFARMLQMRAGEPQSLMVALSVKSMGFAMKQLQLSPLLYAVQKVLAIIYVSLVHQRLDVKMRQMHVEVLSQKGAILLFAVMLKMPAMALYCPTVRFDVLLLMLVMEQWPLVVR
jgi:hypothetical protein